MFELIPAVSANLLSYAVDERGEQITITAGELNFKMQSLPFYATKAEVKKELMTPEKITSVSTGTSSRSSRQYKLWS